MRAGSGRSRTTCILVVLVALLGACGGKMEASCEEPADAAGCGGSSSTYQFEYPEAAARFCGELFDEHGGCGQHNMEFCLARWMTDETCDQEEEAMLACLLEPNNYVCFRDVLLNSDAECQPLARALDHCNDANE